MEEWQRRQRAEKEAARKKKTESAELLRGYRGGVNDEELKLRTLREEERRKTIDAQQHLHNYKGVGGVNEEDLKLRALREEERRKAMEAEQNLHNYKGVGGVNEEELKLRALKEEERRKTMDAQQNLHQYNGTAAVEQQLLQQQKNPKKQTEDANLPVPVNAGSASNKDHLAGVDFGSVSDRAAALAAAAEAAGEIPSPTASYQGGKGSKPTVNANPKTEEASETTIPSVPAIHDQSSPVEEDWLVVDDEKTKGSSSPTEPGSTEESAESPVPATGDAVQDDEKKESFPSEEVLDTKVIPEKGSDLADETPNTATPLVAEEDEPLSTEPSSAPAIDTEEEAQPQTEPDKPQTPQAPTETSENNEKEKEASSGAGSELGSTGLPEPPAGALDTSPTATKESDSSPSQPVAVERAVIDTSHVDTSAPVIASPTSTTSGSPRGSPQSPAVGGKTRVNVLFSFGVVSTQDNPDLFGYMAAVEKVVLARLKKPNCDGITFDPKLRPFVKKTNNDRKSLFLHTV